jgi:hypothetical protein
MLMICGAVLLVLGLVSGALLAASPFGLGPAQPELVTWLLFPAFTLIGYAFLILPARTSQVILVTRICGGALMLLATAAAVGLFAASTGFAAPSGSTLVLWYVLVVGLLLGPAGLAVKSEGKNAETKRA